MLNSKIIKIECVGKETRSVLVESEGKTVRYQAKNFISTIPIDNLIKIVSSKVDEKTIEATNGLRYRSFVSVSVILNCPNPFLDNWIYVHSPEVKLGRIQNFLNWSPFMVDRKDRTTLGLEYFCDEGDDFWNLSDEALISLGLEEIEKLNLAKKEYFVDGFVTRVSKAYPVYDRNYAKNIEIIREYLGMFDNIQTIGRNGMFRYNNMDHSVLSGLQAAGNIMGKKNDVWNIND